MSPRLNDLRPKLLNSRRIHRSRKEAEALWSSFCRDQCESRDLNCAVRNWLDRRWIWDWVIFDFKTKIVPDSVIPSKFLILLGKVPDGTPDGSEFLTSGAEMRF